MLKNKGFTLIELLVAITIVALLSAIGLVTYSYVSSQGRDAKRMSDLRTLQFALEQYYNDNGFYPCANCSSTDPYWGLTTVLPHSGVNRFTNQTGNPSIDSSVLVKTYLEAFPKDPNTSRQYIYRAARKESNGTYNFGGFNQVICNNSATKCLNYCLYAKLDNAPANGRGNCPGPSTFGYGSSNDDDDYFALTPL